MLLDEHSMFFNNVTLVLCEKIILNELYKEYKKIWKDI